MNRQALTVLSRLSDPDVWIERCLNDLYFLCRSVLFTLEDTTPGFKDLWKPTHGAICDFVQEYAKEGNKCLVLTPRGWVKSYVITIGWTIQRLLRNLVSGKREHQIISNATIPNAKSFLEKIKYNLQYNDLLRGLFKEWIPTDPENEAEKWTLDYIQLNGCMIETGSVEGNLVSQHYKVMINDDLVNRDNSATKDQLMKTQDWWKLAQSLLLANGVEINIGTRWAFDDLYGYFIESFLEPDFDYMSTGKPIVELHKGNYHLLWMDCWADPVAETGSTFPTLFSEEFLKEKQKQQGARFNGQYRNNPLALGKNPFQKSWFTRWNLRDRPEIRNTIMLIDPSGKADVESDHSGIVVIHLTTDKRGLIEYGKRHLITDRALADWIVENAPKFQVDTIYIEDMKYGTIYEILELLIPDLIRRRQIPAENLEYVKTIPYRLMPCFPKGRPKEVRIRHLTGMFENGTFSLPHGDSADNLEDELIRFPSLRDDVVDALAYVMDFLVFPTKTDPPKSLELRPEEKMTDEEREHKEWDEIKEAVWAGKQIFADADMY